MSRIQIDNAFECIMDASNPKCCTTIYKNDDDTTIPTIIIHIHSEREGAETYFAQTSIETKVTACAETVMGHSDADTKHLIAWFSNLIGCTLHKRLFFCSLLLLLVLFDAILTLCR